MYRRTQFASSLVLICAATAAFVYVMMRLTAAPSWMFFGVLTVLGVVSLIFSTMTVMVCAESVEWWLTLGLFRNSLRLDEIEDVSVTHVPSVAGYGFRTNGSNRLWRVSGSDVVVMTLKDGRRIALGTPDAQRLAIAIEEARRSRH